MRDNHWCQYLLPIILNCNNLDIGIFQLRLSQVLEHQNPIRRIATKRLYLLSSISSSRFPSFLKCGLTRKTRLNLNPIRTGCVVTFMGWLGHTDTLSFWIRCKISGAANRVDFRKASAVLRLGCRVLKKESKRSLRGISPYTVL